MLLLSLLVAAGAHAGVVDLSSLSEVTSIEGEWLFAPGDDLARAAPDFDDADWQRIEVARGIGEQGHPDLVGHFWYRLHLKGPRARGGDQVALEIRDVDSAYELYVDGYLVGGHGLVTAPFRSEHDRPGLWRVPLSALDDGEAVVAIRGWRSPQRQNARPSRGGLVHRAIRIGPTDVLAREAIIRDLDELVLGGIFIVVGLYHLHLFRRRRALREYLWFGLFSIDIAVYILSLTDLSFDVMSALARFRLAFLTLFMCLPIFVQFLWPFLGRPVGKLSRLFQVACTTWALINVCWPTTWFTVKFLIVFELGLLVPLLIGTSIFIVRRSWQGDPEARTILVGTAFLIFTAANNILRERNILQTPEITNWAFAVFVLSMAVSLSNRFTRVYGDLDHKNAELVKMNVATARFVPYEFLSLLGKETLIDVRKGDQVQKDMAILFSDIRSFTTIVEKKTPEENIAFINRYLEHMEPAIIENGGFVDSFIGDAIMALFAGGPLVSVKAGIAMQRRMPSFNAERASRGEVPIKIGIGINAGPLMLGTIGGSSHIKCGVIGDSVNLASRIEGMTKMYGAALLISDTVRTGLDAARADGIVLREIDRVAAKGKAKPVTIYEVVDADDDSVRDSKLASLPRFHEALALYRARKFIDAGALFEELRRGAPSDVVFGIYADRASKHRAAPPPEPWDGVEHLERK